MKKCTVRWRECEDHDVRKADGRKSMEAERVTTKRMTMTKKRKRSVAAT